jgi:hypothetical protein
MVAISVALLIPYVWQEGSKRVIFQSRLMLGSPVRSTRA